MPTSPTNVDSQDFDQVRAKAIERLRQGINPFAFSVATAGTEQACLSYNVDDLFDSQRSDLNAILDLYRQPNQATRLYPIIGKPGAGKTHLLNTFQDGLQRAATTEGRESLLVVADHFSPGLNAVDFFLWQVINHLLAARDPGARMLRVLADRLTARLLGESLRRLPPTEQMRLIPPRNWWEGLRLNLGMGSASLVDCRLTAVRDLTTFCDSTAPSGLPDACLRSKITPERAFEEVRAHLERTESKDAAGFLRRRFYEALARLSLLSDRTAAEDFLTGGYRGEGQDHVKDAGQLGRRLLVCLLEVLQASKVPIVLVFDQIEDFLADKDEERERERSQAFGRALAALLNGVPGLCLFVFAEGIRWDAMLANLDAYVRGRIDQDFTLPGRPSRRAMKMPDEITRDQLERIIERRVRDVLGEFDPTGLPRTFPFADHQIQRLETEETTVRGCLRRLSIWFNECVYSTGSSSSGSDSPPTPPTSPGPSDRPAPPSPPARPAVEERLQNRWKLEVTGARQIIQGDTPRPSLIPEVQTALECWLSFLRENRIGDGANWSKVELIQQTDYGPYGYLTVIRTNGVDAPGLGLAAWLAERRGREHDLKNRLMFFDEKPCPIRTLVLFRADGKHALSGSTEKVWEEYKIKPNRDVRIQVYEQHHLEDLLAFPRWLQAVRPDVEAAGTAGETVQRAFVEKLSGELLGWIQSWTQATTAET